MVIVNMLGSSSDRCPEIHVFIMVGNFQDVESSLTEKYDYITLIGVFEYSQGYIGTAQPYVEMLRRIARHLALVPCFQGG